MTEIRDHHLADEGVKLAKRYPGDSQKAVQRLQLAVIQRREKVGRGIRTTAEYIIDDYKRASSDALADLPAPTSDDLRATGLMVSGPKMIIYQGLYIH